MNVFDLVATLSLDDTNYKEELDNAKNSVGSILGKIGGAAKKIGTVTAAGITATATAVGAITTKSVEAYASFEQLAGGVETLFGDNVAKTIEENADKAFKTAGLSANDYLDTVTSFSASLIQSLGGDTEKAAGYADRAIIDMADNANKMGTSIESIQTAYAGFAKGNYTMLDNLKLGYGGTKEEMSRLIQDASQMTDVMAKLGITVDADSMSFDNIVNAISVMQSSMNIAGATASEAGTTIEGSINSMKGAWENLMVAFANPDADLEKSIGDLLTSVFGDGTESNLGVLGNVLPAVQTTLKSVGTAIETSLPQLLSNIMPIITDTLPQLLESASSMIHTIFESIQDNKEPIINAILSIVNTIVNCILENLPLVVELGLSLIISLANGISESLPTLIPTIVDVILNIVSTLINNIDMVIAAALQLMIGLATGLIDALPQVIDRIPEIISAIVQALVNSAPQIMEAGITLLVALIAALPEIIVSIVSAVPQIITSLVTGFSEGISKIQEVGKNLMSGLWEGIKEKWNSLKDSVSQLGEGIVNKFKDVFGIHSPSRVMKNEVGKFLGLGLGEGLTEGWQTEYDNFRNNLESDLMIDTKGSIEAPQISEVEKQQSTLDYITDTISTVFSNAFANFEDLITKAQGDIYIPVYLGNEMIDTVVVGSNQRVNYRSGGRV